MSNEEKARFKRVHEAIDRARKEFDEAIDESKVAGSEAREDVRKRSTTSKPGSINSETGPKYNTSSH